MARRARVQPDTLAALVTRHRDDLTPAERRVADALLSDPEAVAFGTVADLARRAGSSGATVIRLAARLGVDGYAELQGRVQQELASRLRPSVERIREAGPDDTLARVSAASLRCVAETVAAVDPSAFDAAVAAIGSSSVQRWVVCGDASAGIGNQLATQLGLLGVAATPVDGNGVRTAALAAQVARGDVVLALDLRRYDRWLVEWVGAAASRGARVVALTDSHLSPLAELAEHLFLVSAEGAGPFDSYVGALALVDALVAEVARTHRRAATGAVDAVEAAWNEADVLLE